MPNDIAATHQENPDSDSLEGLFCGLPVAYSPDAHKLLAAVVSVRLLDRVRDRSRPNLDAGLKQLATLSSSSYWMILRELARAIDRSDLKWLESQYSMGSAALNFISRVWVAEQVLTAEISHLSKEHPPEKAMQPIAA